MNLIIHADQGGELIAELQPDVIRILAIDQGPGIPDVEQAMSAGFSTAPNWIRELASRRNRLVNINKCADSMKLESTVGVEPAGNRYLSRPESREKQNHKKEEDQKPS